MDEVKMKDTGTVGQLLLSVRDAARALAICPRTLWTLTDAGDIRCIRLGRRVLYDPRDLTAWIDRQKVADSENRA